MGRVLSAGTPGVLAPEPVAVKAVSVQRELRAGAPRVLASVQAALRRAVVVERILMTRAAWVLTGENFAVGRAVGVSGVLRAGAPLI